MPCCIVCLVPEGSSAMDESEDSDRSKSLSNSSTFSIAITGQIEKVNFVSYDHVYCKYSCHHGTDWKVVAGSAEGVTQVSKKAVFAVSSSQSSQDIVWNHPLEVTFISCNPFGWPQLVFAVYGLNFMGTEVVRGYGAVHVPPIPGSHFLTVPLFVPEASSLLGSFRVWLTGTRPEFVDAKVVAQGEGRGIVSVQSDGFLFLSLNVIARDLAKQGYKCSS